MMFQIEMQSIASAITIITIVSNLVLIFGVPLAFMQLRTARNSIKAQVLMKLSEEWRNEELYLAIKYIHKLREEWKKSSSSIRDWNNLAELWVKEHVDKDSESIDSSEKKLWNEWIMRRTASQFLAKMGYMMASGYIKPDDLFGVVPETGRLLAVLMPIEIAIQNHWKLQEQNPIAEWDKPVAKWEFNELWRQYLTWYKKKGYKYELSPVDWSKASSASKR